ncbi:glycosyltransferase [Nitrosomonas sp. Nm166]|uniref:glycosyltransferase n=1 Tax=Nitrosomonas sp. Nm166 TaxID=1881054 RepID=UPI0008F26C2F|nr:glycosyltransferase [Nitrosomonas sp. Nm166]SFD95399.1 Glycosyltransferase involved in cell wall bisynthesis [Nitrosomonas sp. Nm166]
MNISKGKIKVMHVINGEFFSGAERVQDVLALRLPDYGYEVGFACVKPAKFSACRNSTVSLFEVPMQSKFDLAPAWEIARIVKQDGYALLHTHTPRAALVGRMAAWLAGVPMVHHVHSPTTRDTESSWRNWMNAMMERLSLIGVAQLIPVSQSLEAYLKKQGWSQDRIKIVANGVVTPGPLPNRVAPASEWVIGSVALFRPRKGMEVLIQALANLHHKGRTVRLRAVGTFETVEYESAIKEMAARLGIADAIDWVGFAQDVNAEFVKMDVLVLPSLFGEGMPMVILEAMATGVPVVASDVEGIPEVLDHGHTGLLTAAGDARQLTAILEDLMNNKYDWQALRENAYQMQINCFSDRSMAKGVAKVYEGILDHV